MARRRGSLHALLSTARPQEFIPLSASSVLRQECLPHALVVQVPLKAAKEGIVERDFAALEAGPGAGGAGAGDGGVDPGSGDSMFLFVARDGEEWGQDLRG